MPIEITKHIIYDKKTEKTKADYMKVLEVCFENEKLAESLDIYPIVKRKFYKVRRLNPKLPSTGTGQITLLEDLEGIEKRIIQDIKLFYRIRNMLVHGAEIKDHNFERILRRLEYTTSFIIDKLLHLYSNNPNHSLHCMHEVHTVSAQHSKKLIADGKTTNWLTIFPRLLYSKL